MSRLLVIGVGYVGLVTSATLVDLGHDVRCADVVPEKVAMLSRGEIPMTELGHPSTSKRSRTTKGAAWTSR